MPTPLSWTYFRDPTELALRRTFGALGAVPPAEAAMPTVPYIAIFHGRAVANLGRFRAMGDAMPGASGSKVERGLFGGVRPDVVDQPRVSRYPVVAAKLPRAVIDARRRLLAQERAVVPWWSRRITELEHADLDTGRRLLIEAQDRYFVIAGPHGICSIMAQAAYEQLRDLCSAAGDPGLETRIGSFGATETELAVDLAAVASGTLSLADFLAVHGYHGPIASEITSTVWREDPAPLEPLLARFRSDGSHGRDRLQRTAAERTRLRHELDQCFGPVGRVRARGLFALAQRYIPLREIGRATFLRAYDVARAASRVIGTALAADGVLEAPEDVAYLTVAEAVSVSADQRGVVARRRARREYHQRHTVPALWTGAADPVPLATGDLPDAAEIRGEGVSDGTAEGRVRVVLDPATDDFEPGEILVCHTTDPAWAPFFHLAAAAVIDIGGAISHGAIVAREFGLPCVINTKEGTRRLRTGQLVRVDGRSGRVTVRG